MALQKKKRNTIIKYIWKKIQLFKLKKINNNFYFKNLNYLILNKKNIWNLNFKKYINFYNIFFNFKDSFSVLLKYNNYFNHYVNDFKSIKFNINFKNSSLLIDFLISFHDCILRDLSNTSVYNPLVYSKLSHMFTTKDISIILNKIKKILKFFYFFNYFNITGYHYYLIFYNYFKNYFNNSNKYFNIILFYNLSNYLHLFKLEKKKFNFNFILFDKNLSNSVTMSYFVKKELGFFYHLKEFKRNKGYYMFNLNRFKKFFFLLLNKYKFYTYYKKLNYFNFTSHKDNLNFYRLNYLNLSLNLNNRNFLYPRYYINNIYLYNNYINKKKLKLSYIMYKKNFKYFNDSVYYSFYKRNHTQNWYHSVFNLFDFDQMYNSDVTYIKSNFLSYQNYYFDDYNWSWHIVFSKINNFKDFNKNIKFFNNKFIKNNFLYFFYKIYKLRVVLNYLIFYLLEVNINLIWSEYSNVLKNKFDNAILNYLDINSPCDDWFIKEKIVFNKLKNKLSSLILKKEHNSYVKTWLYKRINFFIFFKKNKEIKDKVFKLRLKKKNNFIFKNILYLKKKLKLKKYIKNPKFYYKFNSNFFKFLNLNSFIKYKINFIIKNLNKKKFYNKYKLMRNFGYYQELTNFIIKYPYEYNRTLLRYNFFKKHKYRCRRLTLFSTVSSFFSIQYYLKNFINKKALSLQNILLYYSIKKESTISSIVLLYLNEFLIEYVNFKNYTSCDNFLLKINKKKIYIYNNNSNYINSIYFYFFLFFKYLNITVNKKILYKYAIIFYTYIKIFNNFFYIYFYNFCRK